MSPISSRSFLNTTFSKSIHSACDDLKFAPNVRIAISQRSIPATMSHLAALAPQLLPPHPEKMSNTRTILTPGRFKKIARLPSFDILDQVPAELFSGA